MFFYDMSAKVSLSFRPAVLHACTRSRDETDLLPTLFQHNRKDRFGFLGCLAILLFSLSLFSNNHYHTNMPAV